jgi:uncharacterized repeat protein (TIGR01451 family)
MPLQGSGEMSFADVYNEMTGESLANPPISITQAEQGQLQNSSGDIIPLNQYYTPRPDGSLPTVFPTEWYLYCQRCNVPNPYLTISKSGATAGNLNQSFSYYLTITNNGTTATTAPIQISDYLQEGLVYITYGGAGWSINVVQVSIDVGRFSYNVFGTYNGVLQPNQVLVLQLIVNPVISTTYYNYATVSGGGEAISKTSNTTTTLIGGAESWTSSVTKRLVRTIQKNDCGEYGVGSFQEVYSPFFTATYTSTISQADADTNANTNATALCNQWLDANGQSVANQYGTCTFGYPNMTLSKTMPGSFNLNTSGTVRILMRIYANATNGQIVMSDVLPSGFEFVSMVDVPSPFSSSVSGRTVTFTTNNSLPIDYYGEFLFTIRGITVGNYTNFASAYGGNILNNNATSNTVSTYVFGNPSFSFSGVIDNQSFLTRNNLFVNAAPTDLVYHGNVLTINNFPSTNDSKIRIEFELPIPFRVVDDVAIYYNSQYFFFYQGSAFNIVVFEQKNNVTVPVGQYEFYVFFSLPINYFRMSTVSEITGNARYNTNLIIDSLNISIPRIETTLIKNYVNNIFINSFEQRIIWSNNYTFYPIFNEPLGRIPNDVNGLTYTYSVNNQENYSQPQPMGWINQNFFAYNPIYVVNPTRDTSDGFVNPSYPYQFIVDNIFPFPDEYQFGIVIFYKIYKDGRLIQSFLDTMNPYHLTKIDKTENEPKYRNTTFTFLVDPNGNYFYW